MADAPVTALATGWLSYGFAALAYLLLAARTWQLLGWRCLQDPISLRLLLAAVASCVWALVVALAPGRPLYLLLLVQIADVLRYGAWYALLVLLLRQGVERSAAGPARWPAAVAVLLCLLALSGDYTFLLLLPLFGLVLLEQYYRNLGEETRWDVKPFCLALAGLFVFDVYLFSQGTLLHGVDRDEALARPLVHGLVAVALLLAGSRHRHWIARLRVSRRLAFHSASLFLVGAYLLLIAAGGYYVRYFGGDWGRVLEVAFTFLATLGLATILLSRRLRATLRVQLAKHLFHYRYDYRDEWRKFTQSLSSHDNPGQLKASVVRGLAGLVESSAGSLWLLDAMQGGYRQSTRWQQAEISAIEPADSPWTTYMRQRHWVMNLAEYRQQPARYDHHCTPDWLVQLPQAWLMVPLFDRHEMMGFVVLDRPLTPLSVDWEVHDLLKTAARQAASYLAQAQATEALLESRKFEAFNRMSAFVVHDLKNIVTQLSLMTKNAHRHGHDPEFQADMLMTVENSLDRMRQLMTQLREGAPAAGQPVGVELAQIARDWARQAEQRERRVELDLAPDLFARGQSERLRRIVGHLVHNALDATEAGGGRVWLRTQRQGSQACLEVGDQGVGMSADFVRDQLFRPFQTTKDSGMGIGAYESFQYVQELGGQIAVDSQPGQGTRITLLLPALDAVRTSDLR